MDAKQYLGLKQIGDLFGVSAATVSKWRGRYAETDHPTPEPSAWIGDTPGWSDPSDWRGWKATLPGQGAGGGPLPLGRARKELMDALAEAEKERPGAHNNSRRALDLVAAHYGADHQTVMAVWARVAEQDDTASQEEIDVRAIAMLIRGAKSGRI